MHFIFSGVFWGFILILLGLTMILKVVFNIDIPVFRLLLALILIYWGAKLLFGLSFVPKSEKNVVFDDKDITHIVSDKEYNVVFGKSNIDLRNFDWQGESAKVEINVVFGSSTIFINPEIPTKIKMEAVFAEGKLPEGNISFFGDNLYQTSSYKEGENYLLIELDIVFGSCLVRT
jgi:hypothetical protein